MENYRNAGNLSANRSLCEWSSQHGLGNSTSERRHACDADVGDLPPPPLSPYPFVFEQGPLGYLIQRLGDREAAKIVDEETGLMKALCSYRAYLCLEKRAGVRR
jgi:hypothetical protein